jgi:dihydrofolate synthase/folylpolyglutamate synthase
MLSELGDPQMHFQSIHVGGTNGKGSVAATASSILGRRGLRTGLYTSPHLTEFRERVRIEGAPVDVALLEAAARVVLPLAEREDASFFEAATVLAFHCFAEAGVEAAVVEVGLGGRLDATNVISPQATVVTNVAWDHADYLGETLSEIAAEKAGILKPSVPCVVGPMAERVLRVISDRAATIGAPLHALGGETALESVQTDLVGTSFTYRSPAFPAGLALRTPLPGAHQAANAALALRAVELSGLGIDADSALTGTATVEWPGRFQVLARRDGTWVLDLAHNTEAARAMASTLRQVSLCRPIVLLIAILGDKPWREMLDPMLSSAVAGVFTVAPSSPESRRWDPGAARLAVGGHTVEVEPVFERALRRARELAGEGTVVVTGSCYTVGDALRSLGAA